MSDPAEHIAVPGEDPTRERLLAAAAEVFSEQGYDGAGVQAIAKRAGFTTGAIYGRFSGKAELLLEAIDLHSTDEFDRLFAEHGFDNEATDLLNTVGAHLVSRRHAPSQLLLEAFVAARRDPEVAALVRARLDARAERLTALVDQAKQHGTIDPGLDTESVVRFCHAVGLGFLLYEAVDLPKPEQEPWQALIARLVDAIAPVPPDAAFPEES
jgi:AcrR family transcriptional regulator